MRKQMKTTVYDLPTTIEIRGESYRIRSDFRPILDILIAFEDNDLEDVEKLWVMMDILYVDKVDMQDIQEALEKGMRFINLDMDKEEDTKSTQRVLSYEQDAIYIFSAVDAQLGFSSRRCEYLHWWEFMGAFMNIGECFLSTLIHQRKLKQEGKHDKKWWNENRTVAELKSQKDVQDDLLSQINGW